ncbi:MAG: NAD(P)H-dependent glycerol-3-phosphate dehydrogenase [Gammaproteobacteria bacterium]
MDTATTASSVAVIGTGSWGTALAIQLARAGQQPAIWGIEADVMAEMSSARRNSRYLPEIELPDAVQVCTDLQEVLKTHSDFLLCVPSHALREVLERIGNDMSEGSRVAWATKGFEMRTGMLPHEVAQSVLGDHTPLAVLSGPTFASEVGEGLPTAMTVAATDAAFAEQLAQQLSDRSFRAYTSDDMIGVEVGGAVKNVLAIATGFSDGLGFGANTRVALITRGLAEMTRLGVALGASADTFMGLSGMGDLVLTCTDNQSRNRRMGLALAAGKSIDQASKDIQQVVEGVNAARSVREVAAREGVEMPICEQVYQTLYEGSPPDEAVRNLMGRALKPES